MSPKTKPGIDDERGGMVEISSLTLSSLVRPTSLIVSSSTVSTAASSFSATYLLIEPTEQIKSDKSVHLASGKNFYRQKHNLMLTELVGPTALFVFSSTVLTAPDGPSATYLLPVQTEQIKTVRSASSDPSINHYGKRQNLAPTALVRPTPLTISATVVPTDADGH